MFKRLHQCAHIYDEINKYDHGFFISKACIEEHYHQTCCYNNNNIAIDVVRTMTTITSNNNKLVVSPNAIEFVATKGKW